MTDHYPLLPQPGVLKAVNEILGDHNVDKQHSDSYKDIAYLLADVSGLTDADVRDIFDKISKTSANILVSRRAVKLYESSPFDTSFRSLQTRILS